MTTFRSLERNMMRYRLPRSFGTICTALILLTQLTSFARETKVILDFEEDVDPKQWVIRAKEVIYVDKHATGGKRSLKLVGLPLKNEKDSAFQGLTIIGERDWSGYDSIEFDVFVESDSIVRFGLQLGDVEGGSRYWNWHNATYVLRAGANQVSIPLGGLYRGEANGRQGLQTPINPKQITRFDVLFRDAAEHPLYIDSFRLVKEASPPEGIQAYDFGPESQATFPGFTPITWNTVHGIGGNKVGLKTVSTAQRAGADTFPTRLYQDFLLFGDDVEFVADVPDGKCHVSVVFSDCGFWNGNQAHHTKRSIIANDKQVWSEDRSKFGAADYLFRFEDREIMPGDNVWELFVKELYQPATFSIDVAGGKLRLKISADDRTGTKVAAVIIYPDSIKAAGDKWCEDVIASNKKEFESKAVFLGPTAKALEIPSDAKAKGYWLGFPELEDDVTLADAPGKPTTLLQRSATKGQRLAYTFAIRSLKDFTSEVKLAASDLQGPAGVIPASAIENRFVHYAMNRNAMELAYQIIPTGMRRVEGSGLKLIKDVTRQFITFVNVPRDAKAGSYSGTLSFTAGEMNFQIPITVEVLYLVLDQPAFEVGFFGPFVPSELPEERRRNGWYEIAAMFKQNGLNSFCGGPNIPFAGLDPAGKPILNFAACDDFFKQIKRAGFDKPVYSCGGPARVTGLDAGFEIGEVGRNWEKKTGKSFKELLQIVWGAVKEHAEKENWPPINYYMSDEPKTEPKVKAAIELHKAYREAVPYLRIGANYSVHWDSTSEHNLLLQEMFKTLVFSYLNVHSQADFDKAREFGRDIYIYNQGLSRYSFGAYQWAEMRKGVKGRMQWNALALYGYQFFDLDGREPDTGVFHWGRNEIIPTIHLLRCCEGQNDLKFAVTLWNAAERKKDSPDAKAALEFLEKVSREIPVGGKKPPAGFVDDETFRNTCIEYLKKINAR
jgi:hypothetical protein